MSAAVTEAIGRLRSTGHTTQEQQDIDLLIRAVEQMDGFGRELLAWAKSQGFDERPMAGIQSQTVAIEHGIVFIATPFAGQLL